MKGVMHTALLVAFLFETTAFSESLLVTRARGRQAPVVSMSNNESLVHGYARGAGLNLSTYL